MDTPTKLAGFTLGVLAVFAGATGLGAAVGPVDVSDEDAAHAGSDGGDHALSDAEDGGQATGHGRHTDEPAPGSGAELPGGLMISQHGYTLDLARPQMPAGKAAPLRFRVLDADSQPVLEYAETHGKDLHLIAVRRDFAGYQHVHPKLGADGTWSAPLDLSEPGGYRVFADFTPAGREEAVTLGADLSVPGAYDPQPLPEPSPSAKVDGYTVDLEGALVPGEGSRLTFSVSKGGEPVTDLQPYLEAYGHLVALRDGDLAYLHVHPDGGPADPATTSGPDVVFHATAPSVGKYRLFLDFRHGGRVRTAELTAAAGVDAGPTRSHQHTHDGTGEGER